MASKTRKRIAIKSCKYLFYTIHESAESYSEKTTLNSNLTEFLGYAVLKFLQLKFQMLHHHYQLMFKLK